jgi:hypothetical protein
MRAVMIVVLVAIEAIAHQAAADVSNAEPSAWSQFRSRAVTGRVAVIEPVTDDEDPSVNVIRKSIVLPT